MKTINLDIGILCLKDSFPYTAAPLSDYSGQKIIISLGPTISYKLILDTFIVPGNNQQTMKLLHCFDKENNFFVSAITSLKYETYTRKVKDYLENGQSVSCKINNSAHTFFNPIATNKVHVRWFDFIITELELELDGSLRYLSNINEILT